jgi:hypothetical protein
MRTAEHSVRTFDSMTIRHSNNSDHNNAISSYLKSSMMSQIKWNRFEMIEGNVCRLKRACSSTVVHSFIIKNLRMIERCR